MSGEIEGKERVEDGGDPEFIAREGRVPYNALASAFNHRHYPAKQPRRKHGRYSLMKVTATMRKKILRERQKTAMVAPRRPNILRNGIAIDTIMREQLEGLSSYVGSYQGHIS